ncbi:hypothetical protein PMALA_056780 [Plasmodium malariae]|uniref:Uncharacterized protein n=1 Tax=Plasmodium malariae TaxID=5858 RepID=A0A1A8WWM3_PLAMA|nr:hypothetical protein PMALA_056780 [Plasmodium malariae]
MTTREIQSIVHTYHTKKNFASSFINDHYKCNSSNDVKKKKKILKSHRREIEKGLNIKEVHIKWSYIYRQTCRQANRRTNERAKFLRIITAALSFFHALDELYERYHHYSGRKGYIINRSGEFKRKQLNLKNVDHD